MDTAVMKTQNLQDADASEANIREGRRFPCPLFHKWTRWGKPFLCGIDVYQRRICLRCGKAEQRDVGVLPHPDFNAFIEWRLNRTKRESSGSSESTGPTAAELPLSPQSPSATMKQTTIESVDSTGWPQAGARCHAQLPW